MSPSQVYVDDADVEPAAGDLSLGVVKVANQCNNVCANRFKDRLQVVGQKPFILSYQDPASGQGRAHVDPPLENPPVRSCAMAASYCNKL